MSKVKNIITPDKTLLSQLDYVMPRMKYSINYKRIIKWLENFEPKDLYFAIDFIFFIEYIDFSELMSRIDEQLNNAYKEIPTRDNVIIYPGVEKYPKSSDVVTYAIKETPTFKKNKGRSFIIRDLDKYKDKESDTHIIFVDDFIGSGKSFEKGYDTKSNIKDWLNRNNFVKGRFLVAAICMKEGFDFIKSKYPEIKIFSEERVKVFDPLRSPFTLTKNVSKMKQIATYYGKQIRTINYPPYYTPTGFDNSESLIAFSHTTPNNTLPIIWGNDNWYPIFPRFGPNRLQQTKEIKTEVAFYLGIMNRLGIDLYSNEDIRVSGRRVVKYNTSQDHSLLTVLKLKIDGFETIAICQILGITTKEYKKIITYGRSKGFFNRFDQISPIGTKFYMGLMKKTRSKRYIRSEKKQFELKNLNYIPKSFRGMT